MKKFLALLLALVMVMGLATTAFAAENEGTIKNDTNRTYNAYQIFAGTQAENGAVLGDVVWGSGINATAFLNALKTLEVEGAKPFAGCTDAASVAAVLAGKSDESKIANAFANLAQKHLTTATATVAANETKTLSSGYYLLVDTSTTNPSQNPALLQVTNGNTLNIKDKSAGAPTPDKEIVHEDGTKSDADTVNIGDIVTYELKATMPESLEGYDSYKLVFHDTLSAGLEFREVTYASREDCDWDNITTDARTLTFTFADLLIEGVEPGEEIVIQYTAVVTSAAVIGKNGNTNELYLEYSNNPNNSTETKTTTKDITTVFTFELDVTKVDGQNAQTTLAGAQFVLLNETQNKVARVEGGKIIGWVDVPAGENWIAAEILTSNEDGEFMVKGLDQGTYYLKEIKAPAGYNLLTDPVKLVITATVTDTEDKQVLTALTIKVGNEDVANGNIDNGSVGATIKNNAGSVLPETGGMGTTMFYIFGFTMMMAAVVLLVTKKRMADAV